MQGVYVRSTGLVMRLMQLLGLPVHLGGMMRVFRKAALLAIARVIRSECILLSRARLHLDPVLTAAAFRLSVLLCRCWIFVVSLLLDVLWAVVMAA